MHRNAAQQVKLRSYVRAHLVHCSRLRMNLAQLSREIRVDSAAAVRIVAAMTKKSDGATPGARALGPYRHGNRWRVIAVALSGERTTESFPTEVEASARCAALNVEGAVMLRSAVDEYLQRCKDRSRATTRFRLYGLLRLHENDRPVAAITTAAAQACIDARIAAGYAGATVIGEISVAVRFFGWAQESDLVIGNPFEAVKCDVEVKRGKPKLRVNASKQLLAYLYLDHSLEATAVLTAFTLALRASSVVHLKVADLDDDGRLLWIVDDKTPAGNREIEIPDLLRERLLPLAEGKAPQDRLFPDKDRFWLYRHTKRICVLAGVDVVTPHGLRGSGATNAVRVNGSLPEVARAIGHADGGATLKRHYLGGGAVESARGRVVAAMLSDGNALAPQFSEQ